MHLDRYCGAKHQPRRLFGSDTDDGAGCFQRRQFHGRILGKFSPELHRCRVPESDLPAGPVLDLRPEFDCGYLTVPEDRQDPSGPTIKLGVATVRATAPNPAPDPIVYLTGGPGGSALLSAVQRVEEGWNSHRDVIFFDQRGTLKSDPLLTCPEIDQFLAESRSSGGHSRCGVGLGGATQDVIVDHFWPSAAHGFQQLFDDCVADTACDTAYPNVRADFTALVNQLTETPRTVTVADPTTGQSVEVLIDGYKLANLVLTSVLPDFPDAVLSLAP